MRDRLEGLQTLRRGERALAEVELAGAVERATEAAGELSRARASLETQRALQRQAEAATRGEAGHGGELRALELQRVAAFARSQSRRTRELERAVETAEQALGSRQQELDGLRTALGQARGREKAVERSRERTAAAARKRAERADD